jgi:hypothetical protein
MALTPEQQKIVDAVIARAEQACRYAFKHQNFEADAGPYADGFETGAKVCESAISDSVMRHIEKGLAETGGPAEPACPHCSEFGVRTGVEPIELQCTACYGTGIHNKLND